MNPITKALDDIKYNIPFEILNIAFQDTTGSWRRSPISLDEIILIKVIRPRVLFDCNVVGGQQVNISLEGLQPVYSDIYSQVYTIPKERTQNRSILSALSVSYYPYASVYGAAGVNYTAPGATGGSIVTNTAQRVGDAMSTVPPVSVGYVDLVGENTIMFQDAQRITQAYFLRCILANDDNLNNFNPRSYLNFAKLCELAVKAYIYNTMVVKMDQAQLQGGQALGIIKELIDEYKDANQMYSDYLRQVWQSVSFMNSIENYDRFIKLQINPAL